jgi:hypothetical protein
MKCKDINLIEYIDGMAVKDVQTHLDACQRCQKELNKLSIFFNIISPHYLEGKQIERKLESELENIDLARMKPLPDNIKKKIIEIREKSLVSRVKKIIGKGKKNVAELVENILTPQMKAMPASPKDISKTKKKRTKKIKKENKNIKK